jgi:hypothetical protein
VDPADGITDGLPKFIDICPFGANGAMRISVPVISVVGVLVLGLVAWAPARGQQGAREVTSAALQGLWTASAGSEGFHGKWTAVTSSRNSDRAYGAWIMQNDTGDITLQGTWSARKTGAGRTGTWSARVNGRQKYSGSWTASELGPSSKTFVGMLEAAAKDGASGTWSTDRLCGSWSLKRDPWAR